MDTTEVVMVLSLLAVIAQGVGLSMLLAISVRPLRAKIIGIVREWAFEYSFAVALTATLGSLYMSEVADFVPCRLCWFQRWFMYPLVPLLGAALFVKRKRKLAVVALLSALLGASVSVYHILLELFPATFERGSTTCGTEGLCNIRWVDDSLGYLTIPRMALSGFLSIAMVLVVWLLDNKNQAMTPREANSKQD